VVTLAQKIESMRPEEAVEIMIKWEEPLIIDVLRQIDANAEEAGRTSITSYLISLMPREKASRIMYLMTQL
jgi:flagellar protein FlbB